MTFMRKKLKSCKFFLLKFFYFLPKYKEREYIVFFVMSIKKTGVPSNGQAMIVGGVLVQLKSLIIKAER
jgi:hypothetical protein